MRTWFIVVLGVWASLLNSSCKIYQKSDLSIAGGVAAGTSPFNNPVQMLRSVVTGQGVCSLGFVNDTTAFTAAHCVTSQNQFVSPGSIMVITPQNKRISALRIFTNPAYLQYDKQYSDIFREWDGLEINAYREDPTCTKVSPQLQQKINDVAKKASDNFANLAAHDFAILVFPEGTGRSFVGDNGPYFGLGNKSPAQGEFTTKYIGFGSNEIESMVQVRNSCKKNPVLKGSGTRRQGFNTKTVLDKDGEILKSAGQLDRANGAAVVMNGDSGSLWVICDQQDCNSMDVVAVSSGASYSKEDMRGSSTGTGLFSPKSLSLMKSAVECGGRNCAAKFRGYDEHVLGIAGGSQDLNNPSQNNPFGIYVAKTHDGKFYISAPKDIVLDQLLASGQTQATKLKRMGEIDSLVVYESVPMPLSHGLELVLQGLNNTNLYRLRFQQQ